MNEVLRKHLLELSIGAYFKKNSRFSENVILRAIELFFKYSWATPADVVKMLADEGVDVSESLVYQWVSHSAILFEEAGAKHKLKFGFEWRVGDMFIDVLRDPIFL